MSSENVRQREAFCPWVVGSRLHYALRTKEHLFEGLRREGVPRLCDDRLHRHPQHGMSGHVVRVKHAERQNLVDGLPVADGVQQRRAPRLERASPAADVRVRDAALGKQAAAVLDGVRKPADVLHEGPARVVGGAARGGALGKAEWRFPCERQRALRRGPEQQLPLVGRDHDLDRRGVRVLAAAQVVHVVPWLVLVMPRRFAPRRGVGPALLG